MLRGSLPHALCTLKLSISPKRTSRDVNSILPCLRGVSGVELLPIAEILFGRLKADDPKIYGYDAKWTPDSAAYIGTLRRFGLEQNEPELAKTLNSSRWPAGPCSGSAAMREAIRLARPSSSK